MAGQLTLWGAGELLTSFFGMTTTATPVMYLALVSSASPNAYISGAELDEPQAASYARVAIPNSAVYWDNGGLLNVVMLNSDVPFTTAIEDWGTVAYWALCNDSLDGYVYAYGALEAPAVVLAGDVAMVSAGDLSISINDFYVDTDN